MKITIITAWDNEELFAPFFFAHYNYVDKIHILLDAENDDDTKDICGQYGNVEIEKITHRNKGYSDKLLIEIINDFVANLESDWVYVVDADEFIFPATREPARVVLARQAANLLIARMWQTWRHETEEDLDLSKPSIYQRRYGKLNHSKHCRMYNKPIIARPKSGIQWYPGCHRCRSEKNLLIESEENFVGAHWKNADVTRAIDKHINRRKRYYHEKISYKSIKGSMIREAREHLNEPQMF